MGSWADRDEQDFSHWHGVDFPLIDHEYEGSEKGLATLIEQTEVTLRNRAVHAGLFPEQVFHHREGDTVYVICNPVMRLMRAEDGTVIPRYNLMLEYRDQPVGIQITDGGKALREVMSEFKISMPRLMPVLAPWLIARIKVVEDGDEE